ncbi:MAG: DNA polymerase III subunit delta [Clostridia bacterium]|nr:DNA polymerase III subunit delta [Clostridia bacterium]
MEQMIDKITERVAPGEQAWNRETYQAEDVTPADVVLAAQSGGFMGLKRLILVRGVSWFRQAGKNRAAADQSVAADAAAAAAPAAFDVKPLLDYVADPNPDTVLILLCDGTVPGNSRLAKAVNQGGRTVFFPSLKGQAKEKWLADYFRAKSKIPERGVIAYTALMSGDSLLAMKNEADKLLLYVGERSKITIEDANEAVSRGALAGVFDLSDLLAVKKGAAAVETFRRLLLQGEPPQKLLAMLGTQYRNTLAVRDLLERGYTHQEAARRLGLNPYAAKKCAAQARYYQNRQLTKALEALLAADIAHKKGEGEIRDLLETAILRICAV